MLTCTVCYAAQSFNNSFSFMSFTLCSNLRALNQSWMYHSSCEPVRDFCLLVLVIYFNFISLNVCLTFHGWYLVYMLLNAPNKLQYFDTSLENIQHRLMTLWKMQNSKTSWTNVFIFTLIMITAADYRWITT